MINIVIPMAGLGSRFQSAGYLDPKPLIKVWGKPMIRVVLENLKPKNQDYQFIVICQKEHSLKYNLREIISDFEKKVIILEIEGLTEGQICTVLKSKDLINNEIPILTANSDQFIDFFVDDFITKAQNENLDGLIMTMTSQSPKWSYASTNAEGYVTKTAEKKVISSDATTGIYYFKEGKELVFYSEKMIKDNIRVNHEFYTCPVYNYMIADNKKVKIYPIGCDGSEGMYGLGTPEDLESFLRNPKSKNWIEGI